MNSYDDVSKCNTDKYAEYFRGMLNRGILLPPAQFEGLFLSSKHTIKDIKNTLQNAEEVLVKLYKK